MKTVTKLWLLLLILVLFTPIGKGAPGYFKAGPAWGEWGPDELMELAGYVPQGLARLSSIWRPPLPGYPFYMLSAALGVLVTALVMFLVGKYLNGKD